MERGNAVVVLCGGVDSPVCMGVGIADVRAVDRAYLGVDALDHRGCPDCGPELVGSFERAAAVALKRGVEGGPVRIVTPLVHLSHTDIARLGLALEAPVGLTWSCDRGGEAPCRRCDSCVLRARGFAEAGAADPAR